MCIRTLYPIIQTIKGEITMKAKQIAKVIDVYETINSAVKAAGLDVQICLVLSEGKIIVTVGGDK